MFRLAAKLLVSTMVMGSCLVFAEIKPIPVGNLASIKRADKFCKPKDLTLDILCVDKIRETAKPIDRQSENQRGYIELEHGSSLGVEIDGRIYQYFCEDETGVIESHDKRFKLTSLSPGGAPIPVDVLELCLPSDLGVYKPLDFVCSPTIRDSITLVDKQSAIIFSKDSKIALNYSTKKSIYLCGGQAVHTAEADQKPVPKVKKKSVRLKGKQEKKVKGSRGD